MTHTKDQLEIFRSFLDVFRGSPEIMRVREIEFKVEPKVQCPLQQMIENGNVVVTDRRSPYQFFLGFPFPTRPYLFYRLTDQGVEELKKLYQSGVFR